MMKSGATHLHRLLAFVLTLALLMTTWTVPAKALEDWENLAISVLQPDADSMFTMSIPATPVPGSTPPAYWVTLDPSMLGSVLNVSVSYPDPDYRFYFNTYDLSLAWDETMNAQSLDTFYANYMAFDYQGVPQNQFILLYVSTLPMPADVPAGGQVSSAVQVPVRYMSEDGVQLDLQYVNCYPGQFTDVWASSGATQGYTLVGGNMQQVYVDATGFVSPTEVVFTYRRNESGFGEKPTSAPAVQSQLTVIYQLEDGTVLDQQTMFLDPGEHTIWPGSGAVGGLELAGEYSAYVYADANGYASPGTVYFTYRQPYTAPAESYVTVYYYHQDGYLLDTKDVRVVEGVNTVYPDSATVNGLELVGDAYATVTVYADGSTDMASVSFIYKDRAPAESTVTVYYYHENGTRLDVKDVRVAEGVNTVYPDSAAVNGLELVGDAYATVTVYADGSTDVANVTFLYKDVHVAPVTGELTVIYQMDDGKLLEQRTVRLEAGEHTVWPESSMTAGLELTGEVSAAVYVDQGGTVSPNPVVFTYRTPAPVTVPVTINYFDTMGNAIATAQTHDFAPGTHTITAKPADLPAGYELMMEDTLTIEVGEDGSIAMDGEQIAPDELGFYYYLPQTAPPEVKKATVRVHYRDDKGNAIADSKTLSLEDGTHALEAAEIAGYELFSGTEAVIEVTVRNGAANQSDVVFYYAKKAAEPVAFDVTIHYFDTMGKQIAAAQTVQRVPGTWHIKANPTDLPDGYELMMADTLTIVVGEDGSITMDGEKLEPDELGFYYRPVPRAAEVKVTYTNRSGQIIAGPFTVTLEPGRYHTIAADAARVPEAFDAASATSVQVYVSAEGVASPAEVTLVFEQKVVETPIPVGEPVSRYASLNRNSVAFRSEPSTSGGADTIYKRCNKGDKVYVVKEAYNSKNERWAEIIVNNRSGYMMSEYLNIMTQAESDQYAVSIGATPVPTATPEPTESFVEIIEPVTPSPAPQVYSGYALTSRTTALRTGIYASDMSIISSMEANQLVYVVDQRTDTLGQTWSIVSTLAGQNGYVLDAHLRRISEEDAEYYISAWQEENATPVPTQFVSNAPSQVQMQGYAVAIGDNVPLRTYASEYGSISAFLSQGSVVFVTGQTMTENGVVWHSVQYNGAWGYIRSDLLRMMTAEEQNAYLNNYFSSPTPTAANTNKPYDVNGLSSYGYVNTGSVNFRKEPSKDARIISELKRYAFCLVLGSENINGVTWYNVNYGGTAGYIHGDYFYQMSITEMEAFLSSDEYRQGLTNNSPGGSSSDDVGFTGAGGLVSQEDQTVSQWQDPNSGVYVSYEPFNPIATVAPINPTALPTLEPLPGWHATAAPTNTVTPTPTFSNVANVTYPSASDSSDGGSALVWIVVIALLLIAGAGVFAFVRYQQKRRRIAMRAAQRRAQAARSAERPYARQAGPNGQPQPRMGVYPNQAAQRNANGYAPNAPQLQNRRAASEMGSYTRPQGAQYTPYAGQDYGHPAGNRFPQNDQSSEPRVTEQVRPAQPEQTSPSSPTTAATGRVGRRTAYRQAQMKQNQTESRDDQ